MDFNLKDYLCIKFMCYEYNRIYTNHYRHRSNYGAQYKMWHE